MEDGKPQTIDFFEEHTPHALPPDALLPLPKMPPNVYTNVPQVPLNDAVNVLLLDSLNTDVQDQAYVHQQIMDFLKKMEPGTQRHLLAGLEAALHTGIHHRYQCSGRSFERQE